MKTWRLVTLTVGLDLTGPEPTVAAELYRYQDGREERVWQHRAPVAEYGLAGDAVPHEPLRIPGKLKDDVGRHLDGETSLWLRLVPPYGFLGAVPWERDLVPGRSVPVFRVPDRLPVAADQCRERTAVIAVSAPAGSTWAPGYLINHLIELQDQVEVHVFADRETVDMLHGTIEMMQYRIHLHEPRQARQAYAERTGSGTSRFDPAPQGRLVARPPAGRMWADWIAAGLDGRPVGTLQVILDAGWDHDRPILALSPDPNEPLEISRCSYVMGEDIRRLADVLGVATLALGSPPDNPADAASRMIADELGRQRSGPTIYTSLPDDPAGDHLAAAYRTLGAELTFHPSLFAYLQPEHVQDALRDGWPTSVGATVLPSGYRQSPALATPGTDEVPSWVSTSERYVATELAALSRPADEPTVAAPYKQAYEDAKAGALAEIQDIIERHREQS